MDERKRITLEAFREVLTPANVRTSQIINAALGIGVFTFFLVIVFLHFQSQDSVEETMSDPSLLSMMSMVHIVFALSAFAMGMILYPVVIKAALRTPQAGSAEGCLRVIRMATIVRLALMEGAAFFGLVICLLGVVDGTISEYPIYWLNALSGLAMIAFILATFPTRDGLEQAFQHHVMGGER